MLFNRTHGQEILARENLDGLIAQLPINVYYLSDYWGLFNTPTGYDGAYFAVTPRNESEPAALILPALELRRLETDDGTWMPNIFCYSSPADDTLFDDGTPRGANYTGWPAREHAELNELEQRWVNIVTKHGRATSPDAFLAVRRAVAAAGLSHARVAVDDARIGAWLESAGLTSIECVYRPEVFNQIRLVKTAAELELLRSAARINERALLTAAEGLCAGETWRDVENRYMSGMAAQGGRGIYLMCGVGELPGGKIREGEPMLFDGLGQYQHYHGDFGRCVILGEPSREHQRRHAALCTGWYEAQRLLKPGIRYSELAAAVGNAVRSDGFKAFRDPIVHSLGLEHTDDPKPAGVQPQTKPDQTLRADMVVNIDMPHTEIGWGSMHLEDTVRITPDGFEALTSLDLSLRSVNP